MRILLIEDSPDDVRLIRAMLEESGANDCEISQVERLSDAVGLLASAPPAPDVILLDLGLPDASGCEAVSAIVRTAPALPVIVLTGREDERVGLQAVREGAEDFLLKQSLNAGNLFRAIRYGIERKRVQRVDRLLAEVGSVLASTLDYEETLTSVSELAVRELADYCVVCSIGEDRVIRPLRSAHRDGAGNEMTADLLRYPLMKESRDVLEKLEQGHAVRVESVTAAHLRLIAQDEQHLRILERLHATSYIIVPLSRRDRLVGAILFMSTTRYFGEDDEALASKIARIAAPELANAYLYRQAQEAIRTRDRILAIVAHDLRNPLYTISMSADLLTEPAFTDEQRSRQIQIIKRSTARMDRLIKDLLDVARLESDEMHLAAEYENPAVLLREAVELNCSLAEAKSLTLEARVSEGRLPPVLVDRGRIQQVFANLVGNAIKFTPEAGSILLTVAASDGEVIFSVSDNGPGITESDQAHLFTPFWQARRNPAEGAGLGLSITKGIVEAHGGRIGVNSAVGRGTTMTFTVPISPERRARVE